MQKHALQFHIQCKEGDFHGIENIGEEELEYLAVIMYSR